MPGMRNGYADDVTKNGNNKHTHHLLYQNWKVYRKPSGGNERRQKKSTVLKTVL